MIENINNDNSGEGETVRKKKEGEKKDKYVEVGRAAKKENTTCNFPAEMKKFGSLSLSPKLHSPYGLKSDCRHTEAETMLSSRCSCTRKSAVNAEFLQ